MKYLLLCLLLTGCSYEKVYVVEAPLLEAVDNLLKKCPEYPYNQNTWKIVVVRDQLTDDSTSYIRYVCEAQEIQKVYEINGLPLIRVYLGKDERYRWDDE